MNNNGDWFASWMDIGQQNIIYNDEEGYHLYGRYLLRRINGSWTAVRHSDGKIIEFSKSRWAAAWCILDRYNRIIEARRTEELTRALDSIAVEVEIYKTRRKRYSTEAGEILRDKYLTNLDKQKRFQWELDKYIKLARKCQDRGYQNELTRVTGKQKNKGG